uniref:G_PROTEIN_RECEP_F1_2 domain-containing protein n=1 Tax=Parastrongyloides trichosuri TaxID=131310 RepID=A0A0N5A6Q0_PARTI
MDYISKYVTEFNFYSGIIFNTIALIVLFKFSPEKQNTSYKFLMAIQFIVGIITSIWQQIFSLYVIIYNEDILLFFRTVKISNIKLMKVLVSSMCFYSYFNVFYVGALIVARYMLVCSEEEFTSRKALIIFLTCFTSCSVAGISLYISPVIYSGYDVILKWMNNRNVTLIDIDKNSTGIKLFRKEPSLYVADVVILLLFTITYIIIVKFIKKYKKYMKQHENIMSERTIEMNRQFMKILLLQSLSPLLITGMPILIFLIMLSLQKTYSIQFLGTLIHNFLYLCPTINSFLFLVLQKKIRRAFFYPFKFGFNKVYSQNNKVTVNDVSRNKKSSQMKKTNIAHH